MLSWGIKGETPEDEESFELEMDKNVSSRQSRTEEIVSELGIHAGQYQMQNVPISGSQSERRSCIGEDILKFEFRTKSYPGPEQSQGRRYINTMSHSFQPGDSDSGRTRHFGVGGVNSELFKRVAKENVALKQHLQITEEFKQKFLHSEKGKELAEKEVFRLQVENNQLRCRLLLDENGQPMERKENILLKEENERLIYRISILEGQSKARGKSATENENIRLQSENQELRRRLCLLENDLPMNPRDITQLRNENKHLKDRVSQFERQGLVESYVQHAVSSPEASVIPTHLNVDNLLNQIDVLTKKNQALKNENNRLTNDQQTMGQTLNEIYDANDNDLQRMLKEEKEASKLLREECDLAKFQVETYKEDFKQFQVEQRNKESMWDSKFTRIRSENQQLHEQVKEKGMDIMRLEAQYQKEFDQKMKLQEDNEKQRRHVEPKPFVSSQQGYRSAAASMRTGDMSFELNTCPKCSNTFPSITAMQNHAKQCQNVYGGYS